MAKMNFSKVELALEEGLRKMTVSKLRELADIATGATQNLKEDAPLTKKQLALVKKTVLALNRLEKKDRKVYAKLKISKAHLQEKLTEPKKLTPTEWKGLEVLDNEIQQLLYKTFDGDSDEKIISDQQASQQTKRLNINSKWLPL